MLCTEIVQQSCLAVIYMSHNSDDRSSFDILITLIGHGLSVHESRFDVVFHAYKFYGFIGQDLKFVRVYIIRQLLCVLEHIKWILIN